MKRVLLTAFVCVLTVVMLALNIGAANNDIKVMLDGERVKFDVAPQIINNRTMVPIRAIFEELGATVEWDASSKTATATIDDYVVSCTVGSRYININGWNVKMDVTPVIINNRTLIPARFAAEAFNAKVDWVASSRTAYITSAHNNTPDAGTPCSNHTYDVLGYCKNCGNRANYSTKDVDDYTVIVGSGGAEQRYFPFALEEVHGYYSAGEELTVISHVTNYYGGLWYMVEKNGVRRLVYSGDVYVGGGVTIVVDPYPTVTATTIDISSIIPIRARQQYLSLRVQTEPILKR